MTVFGMGFLSSKPDEMNAGIPNPEELAKKLCDDSWIKSSDHVDSLKFPAEIRFLKNGTYSASGGTEVYWDIGEYSWESGNESIKISNAFDEEETFGIELVDNALIFIEPSTKSQISYRKKGK